MCPFGAGTLVQGLRSKYESCVTPNVESRCPFRVVFEVTKYVGVSLQLSLIGSDHKSRRFLRATGRPETSCASSNFVQVGSQMTPEFRVRAQFQNSAVRYGIFMVKS
jgi:hypothetical protein